MVLLSIPMVSFTFTKTKHERRQPNQLPPRRKKRETLRNLLFVQIISQNLPAKLLTYCFSTYQSLAVCGNKLKK